MVAALIVTVPLADLAISNLAACIALAVPLAVTAGEIAGLRPSVDGLIVTLAADEITPHHLTRGKGRSYSYQ